MVVCYTIALNGDLFIAENPPGTPSSASNTGGSQHPHQQRRPTNPNQAAFAAHFLNSLKQFVSSRNITVPLNLFDNEPADPEVPGSTPTQPGVIDVLGKKVDLFRLYFTVIQMGGYAKVNVESFPRLASPRTDVLDPSFRTHARSRPLVAGQNWRPLGVSLHSYPVHGQCFQEARKRQINSLS